MIAKLKAINYGWHHPDVQDSGTWVTQILPFIEQQPLFANNKIEATDANAIPAWFTTADRHRDWQVSVRQFECRIRGRAPFKADLSNGSYPGPVTDYALNVFINSPPTNYNERGFARNGGSAIAPNARIPIKDIADGAGATIIVGGKALSIDAMKSTSARDGDEGIFSPGHYLADNEKSVFHSTGSGRGHRIVANPPNEDVKSRPQGGGVPWMFHDEELSGANPPDYAMDWGGPFKRGTLFVFLDGTVRFISTNARGSVNFARMLYPADGGSVEVDSFECWPMPRR